MALVQWTDEQLLEAVRRCAADEGEPLGIATYIAWRRTQPGATPSEGTIGGRFGGWPGALEAAGIRAPRRGPKQPVIPRHRRMRRFGTVEPPDPS